MASVTPSSPPAAAKPLTLPSPRKMRGEGLSMNLYALLQSRFPADRSAPCLLLPDGDNLSYGALEDGVGRLAALLLAKGVGVGDRVAAQTAKSPQGLMLYLASLQIGA